MGVRWRTTIKSTFGAVTWRVDIIDTSYIGAIGSVELAQMPALKYNAENDERYEPIKSSSITLPLVVDAGSTLETWLFNDVLQAKEERFFCNLYKNNNLYWSGVLQQDLGQFDDNDRYVYDLEFTDGLNRLKKLTAGSDITSNATNNIRRFINICLQRTPLFDNITNSDTLYSTSVQWYEANIGSYTTANDPMDKIFIQNWAFCDFEEDGTPKPRTYYEILEQVLLSWNCRIILSEGYFRIIQINTYNDNAWFERKYLKTFAFQSSASVAWDCAINGITAWPESGTNVWQHYPALREIRAKYRVDANVSLVSPSVQDIRTSATSFVSDVFGGTNRRLRVTGIANVALATAITPFINLFVQLRVKIGIYYLRGSNFIGQAQWTTNSADTYTFVVSLDRIVSAGTGAWTFEYSMEFTTPDIPVGVHTSSTIQIVNEAAVNNTNQSTVTILTGTTFFKGTFKVQPVTNAGFFNYLVRNTSGIINSVDFDFDELYMGDQAYSNDLKGLMYNDGTNFLGTTPQWRIKATGASYGFNELFLLEIMAGQVIPNKKYQGNFIANANPHDRFTYRSESYIFNGGTLELETMRFSGEWFKIYADRTPFTVIENRSEVISRDVRTDTMRLLANNQQGIYSNNVQLQYMQRERNIALLTSGLTGTITALPVTALTIELKAGEQLNIYDPYEYNVLLVTLSADANIADTSISINSVTLTKDMPEGAGVAVVPTLGLFEGLRITNIPTTNPGVSGVIYSDGGNLKIS